MHIVLVSPENWDFPDVLKTIDPHRVTSIHVNEYSLESLVVNNNPDLIFLGGFDSSNDEFFEKVISMSIANPSWLVVPFLQGDNFTHVLRAMRKGIREILSSTKPDEISYIVSRAQAHGTRRAQMLEKRQSLSKAKREVTRIGVVSSKGGDGGSAIVSNSAAGIARDPNVRVLLIDLSMELGDLDLYLASHRPSDNLSSIVAAIDRLDGTLLNIMVHHCSANFDMISSPEAIDDVFDINASSVERLIDFVSLHYDFVLIDMGTGLNPITLRIWKKIGIFITVVTLSIASARRATQILALRSRLESLETKSYVVANKVGSIFEIPISDFEHAIGQNIWKSVPLENEISNALLTGTPMIDSKSHSKFAHAIFSVVSELTGNKVVGTDFLERVWTIFKKK